MKSLRSFSIGLILGVMVMAMGAAAFEQLDPYYQQRGYQQTVPSPYAYQWMDSEGVSGQVYVDPSQQVVPGYPCP